jgi:hypothetical protein
MKRNKKSSGNGIDTVSTVEIAPSALANLADKLKVELANPSQAVKPSKPKKNKKEANKVPQTANTVETPFTINGHTKTKKDVPTHEKADKKTDSKNSSGSVSKNVDTSKTTNGDVKQRRKSQEKDAKQTHKTEQSQSKVGGHSKDSARKSNTTKTKRSFSSSSKEDEHDAQSLLEEILALGGTKEDLELIDDIDSDEDIIGESQQPPAKKIKETSDQKVCSSNYSF